MTHSEGCDGAEVEVRAALVSGLSRDVNSCLCLLPTDPLCWAGSKLQNWRNQNDDKPDQRAAPRRRAAVRTKYPRVQKGNDNLYSGWRGSFVFPAASDFY